MCRSLILLGTTGTYCEIKTANTRLKTKPIISQLKKLLVESGNFCSKNSLTDESRRKEINMKI